MSGNKFSNGKTRSKRSTGGSKGKGKFDKSAQYEVDSRRDFTKHNDASWYNKGSQLVLDAGRLAYAMPVGAPINLDSTYHINTSDTSGTAGVFSVPGVMELDYIPTIGIAKNNSDPVNVSMRNIYSWIRHANSGHTNYDAPDLMLYLLAMDSVYQYYAHMCRTYGLIRLYSQTNRHLPLTVFKAIGVNYNDLMKNMSDFRAYINTFGVRIGSFAVPNTMDYFTRHLWMASGLYMDAPTTKAQAYIFKPGVLGKYDELNGAGRLIPETTLQSKPNMTFDDFRTLGDSLLDAIVASEDFGIMSGDILKAYSSDQLIKVMTIADDFTVIPAYSEEVLRQIQNATVFDGSIGFQSTQYIYQDVDSNTLRSGVAVWVHNKAIDGKRFMLSNVESPTPDEVMVDSRLSVLGKTGARGAGSASAMPEWAVDVSSSGSEIIFRGKIWNISGNLIVDTPFETYGAYGAGATSDTSAISIPSMLMMMSAISSFKYHPFLYTAYRTSSAVNDDPNYMYTVGDIDNYTVVDDIEIEKLHNAALLSLFNVPQVGR